MTKKILFTFILVISVVSILFIELSVRTKSNNSPTLLENNKISNKEFRLVSKHDAGEYISYIFHSSEERVFKTYDDCFGCPPYEDGDTNLWRQFMSKKDAKETFSGYDDSDNAWKIVKGSYSEKDGIKRKIVVVTEGDEKVEVVRILWIEPSKRTYRYWFIQAPSVQIAKEFEDSKTFQTHKKSMPSEPPTCNSYGVNSSNYDWCK